MFIPPSKSPTPAVARAFEQTRAFYKGGAKSYNKIYDLDEVEGSLRMSASRRNDLAAEAEKKLNELQQLRYEPIYGQDETASRGTVGSKLVEKNVKFGNCTEMSYVAYHYLRSGGNIEAAALVGFDPGDHVFLAVGPGVDKLGKISELKAPNAVEFQIIDPWMNICCWSSEYEAIARKRLDLWAASGKRIRIYNLNRARVVNEVPNGFYYSEVFFGSKLDPTPLP